MVSQSISKQQNYFATIFLIITWILGNLWTFQWWFESFKHISSVNFIVLTLVVMVLLIRLAINDFFQLDTTTLKLNLYPILLILGGEISAIALKWYLNIPQLTLLCFILGSYGLLGLFITPKKWYRGLSVAFVFACVVPFVTAFNSGLGFPVRVLTAHAVAQVLADFHLAAASSHDIIVLENGIAQVDLPCSGMKSLWTGTVFLLGVTWLEKRQLGFRWLLVVIANLGILISVNILRVLILVMVIEVWQQKTTAEVLHLPLGIIGFAIASLLTWLLLQRVPRQTAELPTIKELPFNKIKFNFSWLLTLVIILGILGNIDPNQIHKNTLQAINLPKEISTETIPLTTPEANFFDSPANPIVQKLRFESGHLSGSMLLVQSDTWQAHHPPELCFVGNGFQVDKMESKLINNNINARWLSLQKGKLSATYWFQSQKHTTDDFVSRIWNHITQRHQTWVLASILFDQPENSNSQDIQQFTNSIYQAINLSLNIKH
ncbi:MAG: exosortase O [Waterburya sp.]